MSSTNDNITARIVTVKDDLVTIESLPGSKAPLMKNEVIYIVPSQQPEGRVMKLKAEILRIRGNQADAQVYEDTRGVAVGDGVEQTGEMLSVYLGPGMLSQIYDGLQNPLEDLAQGHGLFLPKGVETNPLNPSKKWEFHAAAKKGDRLKAGGVLGTVQEGRFTHKIMVPFDTVGEVEVVWIEGGEFTVLDHVACIKNTRGQERKLTMAQPWPVRRALAENMLKERSIERLYPSEPLVTSQRIIDTFFPIARGGTACIPGPFGSGKTVLQSGLSRFAHIDIVIVVACGERAGEVVETITEFPHLPDPQTGGVLMDRTIIICNTSSMPVAAREASIFTGITMGEYYRQMGYNVLLIADSTSRWAQAMRETSGRMEEIPGEEAFPAYLDSAIRGMYERAGLHRTNDGSIGSLTMVGTVSPAGGNFEEPVTQSTLRTVKCFLGLSAARAYKRFYPAVDPLISWSRYFDQTKDWFDEHVMPGWTDKVHSLQALLAKGDSIYQMMQVTGVEGITQDDYITYQKSLFTDMVYLQQNAFDDVDCACPIDRQREMMQLLLDVVESELYFEDKEAVRKGFLKLTNAFRNMNSAVFNSAEYDSFKSEYLETVSAFKDAVLRAAA